MNALIEALLVIAHVTILCDYRPSHMCFSNEWTLKVYAFPLFSCSMHCLPLQLSPVIVEEEALE